MESSQWEMMKVRPKDTVEGMGGSGSSPAGSLAWMREGLLGLLGFFLS